MPTAATLTVLAKILGISRERLSRIRATCPPIQGSGPYDPAAVRAWLDQHHPEWQERVAVQVGAQTKSKCKTPGSTAERIAEARARKLTADAELSEIELALRRREAWPAHLVRARWSALTSALIARLEALCVNELPARLGGAPTVELAAAYRTGLAAVRADFSEETFAAQVLSDQRAEENRRRRA